MPVFLRAVRRRRRLRFRKISKTSFIAYASRNAALMPMDETEARLILRYQTTAENSFYRNYNALKKEQQGRESGAGAGEVGESLRPLSWGGRPSGRRSIVAAA